MTEQEEFIKKAEELIGSWIYDKTEGAYLYVCNYYETIYDGPEVKLNCIAIYKGDAIFSPYIKEEDVCMSDFDDFYREVSSDIKCIETWEKIKKHYDKMFKVI